MMVARILALGATRYRIAHMSRSRLCTMVVLLVIGGCAGPMGTIHSNPPLPPVTSFDGSYRSTIKTTHPFVGQVNTWCDTPGQPIITVRDGQFAYTLPHPNVSVNLDLTFAATIAQDGSFYGENVTGSISGRVDGTHMEGKIDGSGCVYAFTGNRI
jgi:hypothetical protein